MIGTVAKWGAVLGAAATAGLGLLGKSAIEGASSLEGYRNTLNVVMKDTKLAGETFAWAVDFANKTPFETESIVQATVRLTSYGLKAKEVMPAIGDMAGVMNKDIMEAVEAVADAQTGELERMKEFGITKQMIIDQGNKIMKGKELVNSKGQIVDQENFNKAMFSLMESKFKGGMDLQANSFKGLWSTVTGVFKTSLAMMMGISKEGEVVVGGMFDTIKGKVKILADLLTKWSTDGTIDRIGKVIQTTFGIVSDVFKAVVDYVKDVMIPTYKALYDWIAPYMPAIKQFIVDAFTKIKEMAKTVSDFIITYVIPAFKDLKEKFDEYFPKIKAAVQAAYEYLKPHFDKLVATIKSDLMPIIMMLWDTIKKAMPGIKAIFQIVMPFLVWAIGLALDAIGAFIGLVKAIYGFIKPPLDLVFNIFSTVFRGIQKIIEGVQGVLNLFNRTPMNDKSSTVTTNYRDTGQTLSSHGNNAAGTDFWRGGTTWVGEEGPEIVNLPRGSQVIPNDESMARANSKGNGLTLSIGTFVNNRKEDIEELAIELEMYRQMHSKALGGAY